MREINWTNESVKRFAGALDPVEAVTSRAREIVVEAIDQGWTGPPFDPFVLADLLHLETVPRADIQDARTVPMSRSQLRIEFNPNRAHARLRYSVAHEIAHTLFPDCAQQIRNRAIHLEPQGDEWQLEALCNIAAAEFLIPLGSLPHSIANRLTIDAALEVREHYLVSTEAAVIRLIQVTEQAASAFCASPVTISGQARYRTDYLIGSRNWSHSVPGGKTLPAPSLASQCTAIGYTAKGDERWGRESLHIECVGVPPYPGYPTPRVVGIATPTKVVRPSFPEITYVRGDALTPRGHGRKLLVHVVNDATPNWGGSGFATQLRRVHPKIQEDFRTWATTQGKLTLGTVRIAPINDEVSVASMVAQKGYGTSQKPRIRYSALRRCLEQVSSYAREHGMSAHMPRIGAGQAGGSWDIVEDLVSGTLCAAGVEVTVYDLPNAITPHPVQQTLQLKPT
jgi:O-acetyl-ADP-ribose deacetylase (regulator of RNase III)